MTLPEQERERFCQVLYHSRTSLYRLAFSITRNSSDAQVSANGEAEQSLGMICPRNRQGNTGPGDGGRYPLAGGADLATRPAGGGGAVLL